MADSYKIEITFKSKDKLYRFIEAYKSYYISDETLDTNSYSEIIQNIKHSKAIIIDNVKSENKKCHFFILSFYNTLIIINKSSLNFHIQNFFSKDNFDSNDLPEIYFINDTKDIFNDEVVIQNLQHNFINKNKSILNDEVEIENFLNEISSLNNIIENLIQQTGPFDFKKEIVSCISGYLIREGYVKLKEEKKLCFNEPGSNINISFFKDFNQNIFIQLRNIGSGNSPVLLYYRIDKRELVAGKLISLNQKLLKRELNNYHEISFPLIPKFYGTFKESGYILIQFINGRTLGEIKNKLSFDDIVVIIFELMLTIKYLHEKGYIYRDLKPSNILIDETKTAFLIDFDRMIKLSDLSDNDESCTKYFGSEFLAPEGYDGKFSMKSDIYSLGKIISYLIKGKSEKINIIEMCNRCTNKNEESRPSISEIIFEFYKMFYTEINKSIVHNFKEVECMNGIVNITKECIEDGTYVERDINKAINYFLLASNQNYAKAQFNLGLIYYEGKYIERDINKAIDYFSLASNQNYANAQFYLGLIYYEGTYIKRDINKAIDYFSLASNQNDVEAQFYLGHIYYDGKYIERDINKAIHYFSLASNQNHAKAQFNLGLIYYIGKYTKQNINQAIHYYLLASNQNYVEAQFYLGIVYYEGRYIKRNINKSMEYFWLASNQNHKIAQFYLGLIYYEGTHVRQDIQKSEHYFTLSANQKYFLAHIYLLFIQEKRYNLNYNKLMSYLSILSNKNHPLAQFYSGVSCYAGKYETHDINKAIHYLSLSVNQNCVKAQFFLGYIYYEGKYIEQDINKAIHYFSLASNQNCIDAQFFLGLIYYERTYIERGINKAIHYFSLASNQNHSGAQYMLGLILYEGKYIKKDINKAIHYFSLASIQNDIGSQFNLGCIYYEGKYIKRDINKAIHYFQLASKQNDAYSQFQLGIIYYEGMYVTRDINKSIHYFLLASNQNDAYSQFRLGLIYEEGRYIKQDINKAIYYYTLASDQKNARAQFYLGLIYYEGRYVKKDINKALRYFIYSAKQNYRRSQYLLGIIYLEGEYLDYNIDEAIYYLKKASEQKYPDAQYKLGLIYSTYIVKKDMNKALYFFTKASNINDNSDGIDISAHFIVGYFYHEGIHVTRDIQKAIHHYKEASSFNSPYAKNNLGIIYKNGSGDKIQKSIGTAIEYFKEAIGKKEDVYPIFNLSHIYIYEKGIENGINNAIELLLQYSDQSFNPSDELLCIALIKMYGYDIQKIDIKLPDKINQMIKNQKFDIDKKYKEYENVEYLYDFLYHPIQTKEFDTKKLKQQTNELKKKVLVLT